MKKKEQVKVNAEELDIINYIGNDILTFMKEGQQGPLFSKDPV